MPLNKKGQVFTWDIAVATLIFMIILGVIIYLWTDTVEDINSSEMEYEMVWLATAVSEQLVRTPGVPYNWTMYPEVQNITVIGLSDVETIGANTQPLDRVLDPNKMLYFINTTKSRYAVVKNKLFGTGKYDYYIEFACLDPYTTDCFNNLHAEMIDVENITCDNGVVYYIQNHSTRVDRALSGVWRFNEGRENQIYDGSGNKNDGQVYGALRASFSMDASSNSYAYEDLVNVTDYTIQAGDFLEYDVYWTSKDDKIAFDYTTQDGSNLRNVVTAVDQNSLRAHPATDLSQYALKRWYHRKIALPAAHTTKTIRYYDIACENHDSAMRTAYLDNIVITNGTGTIRKTIYAGGSPEHTPHLQNTGSLYLMDDYPAPPEWNAAGKYKYSLTLDGVDDYAQAQDTKLKLGINQTIAAWVNIASNSSDWVRIVGKGNFTLRNYGLWRETDGDLLFQIYGTGGNCNFWTNAGPGSPLNLPPGLGWVYITATYDGTEGRMYINGAQVYSGMCTTTPYTSDDPLTIGYAGFNAYLNGSVDDVIVWNRTLSPTEVMDEYLHTKKACVSGHNISINDTDYMIYDTKTATFSQSREDYVTEIDADAMMLEPTITLQVVIYRPAKLPTPSGGAVTTTTAAAATTTTTTTTSTTTTTAPTSSLSCIIRNTACGGGETCVFRMSDISNAHAGTCSDSSYTYRVCCSVSSGTLTVGTQDGGCAQDGVISLSTLDNAHVETYPSANYVNDICMSASSGTISCDYLSSCPDACLGSMSSATNAHAGDCSAYTTKICCKVS